MKIIIWIVISELIVVTSYYSTAYLLNLYSKKQKEIIKLLEKQTDLLSEQLKQCKEIIEKQYQDITRCDQFILAFIASTKKEMQEKDRMIQILRKVQSKK